LQNLRLIIIKENALAALGATPDQVVYETNERAPNLTAMRFQPIL